MTSSGREETRSNTDRAITLQMTCSGAFKVLKVLKIHLLEQLSMEPMPHGRVLLRTILNN